MRLYPGHSLQGKQNRCGTNPAGPSGHPGGLGGGVRSPGQPRIEQASLCRPPAARCRCGAALRSARLLSAAPAAFGIGKPARELFPFGG